MILRSICGAALAGAALCAASPAAAQFDAKPASAAEAVQDGVYGFCPLVLAGQMVLKDNPQLTMRGYSATTATTPNARWGAVETVSASFADGEVRFGGVNGKVCTVEVTGAARADSAKRVRDGLSFFSQYDVKPDPANSSTKPGAKIEAFAGKIDATTFLHLFIVTMDAPNPALTSVALYASDK